MRKSVCFMILLSASLSAVWAQEQRLYSFRSRNYPDRYIRHRTFLGYLDPIVAADKAGRADATFLVVRGLTGKCNSLESFNHRGYFLRHQHGRLTLAKRSATPADASLSVTVISIDDLIFPVSTGTSDSFEEDATFCIVPGLGGAEGRSFESVNFPGHYIRQRNFELWLAKPDGNPSFNQDATFVIVPPLTRQAPEKIDEGTRLKPADPEP